MDEKSNTLDALSKEYILTGSTIRNIAEAFGQLGTLRMQLDSTTDPEKKYKIALRVRDEALPFYRENMPAEIAGVTRQIVNPGILEEKCLKIINEYVNNSCL